MRDSSQYHQQTPSFTQKQKRNTWWWQALKHRLRRWGIHGGQMSLSTRQGRDSKIIPSHPWSCHPLPLSFFLKQSGPSGGPSEKPCTGRPFHFTSEATQAKTENQLQSWHEEFLVSSHCTCYAIDFQRPNKVLPHASACFPKARPGLSLPICMKGRKSRCWVR